MRLNSRTKKPIDGLPTWRVLLAAAREVRRDRAATKGQFPEKGLGLVLSGGGGKGAYEVGCLRALQMLGIRSFGAVTGTSVGSLNGLLVTQDDLAAARRIWLGISPGKILPVQPLRLLWGSLARLLVLPVFLARGFPELMNYAAYFEALVAHGYSRSAAFVQIVPRIAVGIFVTMGAGAFASSFVFSSPEYATMIKLAWPIFSAETAEYLRRHPVILPVALILLLAAGLGLLVLTRSVLSRAHDWIATHLSLFSGRPLRELVEANVNAARLKTDLPFIMTTARAALTLRHVRRAAPLHHWPRRAAREIEYDLRHVPVYVDARKLDKRGLFDQVLQSAALPEIFPRRILYGKSVMDGGVADNTPILPMLRMENITHIVVIYLEHIDNPAKLMEDEIVRVLALSDTLRQVDIAISDAERIVRQQISRLRDPDYIPGFDKVLKLHRIVVPLIPSRPLGGLFSGTLNFTNSRARKLMWLGYWDTLAAVRNAWHRVEFQVVVANE